MTGDVFDPVARNESFDTPETWAWHDQSLERERESLARALDEAPPPPELGAEPAPELAPGEDMSTFSFEHVEALEGMSAQDEAARKLGDLLSRYGIPRGFDPQPAPAPPLIDGLLMPGEMTLLYGDSGTGKGMVAAWHIARATQREERVLVLDFEGHRKEWERRLGWFHADPSNVLIWEPVRAAARDPSVPMLTLSDSDDLRAFREVVEAFGADIVVVDSVMTALGTADVMGPEAARLLSWAGQYLGTTSLAISHLSKAAAEEGQRGHSYGSALFRAFVRGQWAIEPRQSGGHLSDGGVLLVPTKANEYPGLLPFEVQVVGSLETGDLDLTRGVFEGSRKPRGRSALDEAWPHLPTEAPGLTAKEVFDAVESAVPSTWVKYDSLQKALGRAVEEGRLKDNGEDQRSRRFWRLT